MSVHVGGTGVGLPVEVIAVGSDLHADLFAESLRDAIALLKTHGIVEGEIVRTAEWADNPEPASRWRDRIPTGRQTITFTLTIDTNDTRES